MSTGFNPRKPPKRNTDYQEHDVSGLGIAYAVKSGSHDDASVIIEGTHKKARVRLAANDEEQAVLILEGEEIEALYERLGEVLEG